MFRTACLCGALLLPLNAVISQNFQILFPDLSGAELLDSVTAHYRPSVVYDYAHARDTLYARVLAVDDDTLRCIYSGYGLYLAPGQDPTQYVYLNGSSLGMNTEHAYPQAMGASEGNARSDMHHLFPARIPVNEARGNSPFADIPDTQTQQWFRGTQVLSNAPSQHRDQYSESRTGLFEPREAVKGDLARAVFYFYTMYRAQANAANPDFFESQRPTLCQWAAQDPADAAEWTKTWRIAPYQEGKPNPFVVDCTLAQRCWCPETPDGCAVPVREAVDPAPLRLRLSPNPVSGPARLELTLPFDGALDIRLLSWQGLELRRWEVKEGGPGAFSLSLDILSPSAQGAVIQARLRNGSRLVQQAIPVFIP